MQKPDHHFLVCASFRVSGEPQGVCANKGAANLLQYLENEIADRGLNAMVSSTGCLKFCDRGPILIHYPFGAWFGEMNEDKIDQLFDAIEEGSDTTPLQLA